METKEKIIKEVQLIGTKENICKYAFNIPRNLQSEWTFFNDEKSNRYYIGDKFPPFRVCLIITTECKYILRYIIPTGEQMSVFDANCMKYFLNEFQQYAASCNIYYEIIYEESDGE